MQVFIFIFDLFRKFFRYFSSLFKEPTIEGTHIVWIFLENSKFSDTISNRNMRENRTIRVLTTIPQIITLILTYRIYTVCSHD